MKKFKTIHTARTIMFSELERIMTYSADTGLYLESLGENIFGKKSSDGIKQTGSFLKKLYGFDNNFPPFLAFKYFWKITEEHEKPLITFIYAINQDDLLAESVQVLQNAKLGEKATIESFEEIIEKYHPNQYSSNTRRSMAQNIASSWKQAGYIEGKVKNIRVLPEVSFRVACFAFLQAYLKGDRGDFIWNSLGVNALCLPEKRLRDLAIECAKRDLMQYQFGGSVTVINFSDLLTKIGIHGE